MTINEFLQQVLARPEKTERNFAEVLLNEQLTGEVKKLTDCMGEEPQFFDDEDFYRLLCREEAENCEEELGAEFFKKGLLPLIDLADNDFICWDDRNGVWVVFNVVDGTAFAPEASVMACMDGVRGD